MQIIINGFEKPKAGWHFFFFGQVRRDFIKSEKPALQLTANCLLSLRISKSVSVRQDMTVKKGAETTQTTETAMQ